MIGTDASNVAHRDEIGVVTALAIAKWLRLAAAPTFMTMALLTVVLDRSLPNPFCTAPGSVSAGGMAPMYALMAAFHLGPWLKLVSRRRNVAQHS